MRLTDISIRTLPIPSKGSTIHYDDTLAGFGVRVSEGGTKSFILTHGPTRHRQTLGRVGIVGLKEARGEAKRLMAEYTLGKRKTRSLPWDKAVEEYLDEIKESVKPRTLQDYRWFLSQFRFGRTPVNDLVEETITKKLSRYKGMKAEYIHAFVVLRAFFNWAYRRRYLDESPLARLRVSPYNERDRVLSDEEIGKVWRAAGDDTYGRIVKQLITTGQRRGEIVAFDKQWLDGDLITWPSWLTKNSREHTFPIGPLTLALLGNNQWHGWSKVKGQLDERSGVSGWVLHDLRRTFRTKWAELGISKEVAKRYINHVTGDDGADAKLDRIYNRYNYLREMREAVTLWEDHLSNILANA